MEKLIEILSENNVSEESINNIVMALMKGKKKEPSEKSKALHNYLVAVNKDKESYKKGVETPEVKAAKNKYKALCCSLSESCYNDIIELVEEYLNEKGNK